VVYKVYSIHLLQLWFTNWTASI